MCSLRTAITSTPCLQMEWRSPTRKWSSWKMKAFHHTSSRSLWTPSSLVNFRSKGKTCLKFLLPQTIFKWGMFLNNVVISCWLKLFSQIDLMYKCIVAFGQLPINTALKKLRKPQITRWHPCIQMLVKVESSCQISTQTNYSAFSIEMTLMYFRRRSSSYQWCSGLNTRKRRGCIQSYRSSSFGSGVRQSRDWRTRNRRNEARSWDQRTSANSNEASLHASQIFCRGSESAIDENGKMVNIPHKVGPL